MFGRNRHLAIFPHAFIMKFTLRRRPEILLTVCVNHVTPAQPLPSLTLFSKPPNRLI